MPETHKIGIAGAGIGGLAAATLLAQAGHHITVFDQFDRPRPVGSGLIVQPVGLAALDAVGAGDRVRMMGARISRLEGYEINNGLKVLDVGYNRRGDGRHGVALHRSSLFDALLSAARAAGVTLKTSSRVVATQLRGRRWLTLDSGADVGPFDLVLDAAGARSPLSPIHARPLPYGAVWSHVPWPEDCGLPYDRLLQRYDRAHRMAGILPIGNLPDDDTRLGAVFWSLRIDRLDDWHATPLAAWKAEVCSVWRDMEPFLSHLATHDDLTVARYGHGTLKRPFGPRLAHLGDAAHQTSPQLGQGANMALLDAAALAQAVRTHDLEDALPEYARLRRWHIRAYQAMSAAFTPQYQSGSRILPIIRDRLLMPVSRIPPVPAILTSLVCGDLIPPLRGTPRSR